MRQLLVTLTCTLLLLSIWGCGGDKGFVIECNIEGLDNRGVVMTYITRGGLASQDFHPEGGKVKLKGQSAIPTLVEVSTLDGPVLFTCVAADGDRLKVSMKLDEPSSLKITGQEASQSYTTFITANDSLLRHGSPLEVNELIARHVRANTASMSSTLLMVTKFRTPGYELLADSLMSEIASEARGPLVSGWYASALGEQVATTARGSVQGFTLRNSADTTKKIIRFYPGMHTYSLLAIGDWSHKPDSLRHRLRDLRDDFKERRLYILELSLAADSLQWRSNISRDSAKWVQGWVPGGPNAVQLRRMAIPSIPYYIVIDSTGAQAYRGRSIHEADSLLRFYLGEPLNTDTLSADTAAVPNTPVRGMTVAERASQQSTTSSGRPKAPRREEHHTRRPGQ